jgi:hypothetical protein
MLPASLLCPQQLQLPTRPAGRKGGGTPVAPRAASASLQPPALLLLRLPACLLHAVALKRWRNRAAQATRSVDPASGEGDDDDDDDDQQQQEKEEEQPLLPVPVLRHLLPMAAAAALWTAVLWQAAHAALPARPAAIRWSS